MPSIVLTIGQDGKPCGMSATDQAHYGRFRRRVMDMKPGETISFSWETPRSPELHRRHFLMLKWIFENQEVFSTDDELRKWTERGARHVEVMSAAGLVLERVKSISYAELDDDEFRELHKRVKAFLLTHEALTKLWPHAAVGHSYDAMRHMLEEGL
jgi:hypothetical protein